MPSNKKKDTPYYTLSVDNSLRILFEKYIKKHPNLGFKNVSSYMHFVLQKRAEEIIEENPELKEIKEIDLGSGKYILQDDGSYKKID